MARVSLLALGIVLLCCAGSAMAAREMELFKPERFQGGPWLIRAERLTYDAANHLYLAEGRVEIRQGDRRLSADKMEVNDLTKIAHVQGNVVFVLDQDIFTGQEGRFNLATRSGEMYGARLFLRKNHFHVDSPLMRKTGERTYYAEDAKVTTCDADNPVWSFTARRLNVEMEGYATGKGGVMRLAGLPVLYLPTAILPVMTTRQTGFLMPSYGQHRAGGTVVEAPFYWAVDNFTDATLYQTVLSNRGYMQGVEFRREGHRDAAFNFRFSYINDSYAPPNEGTTNRRYWTAGMINQPVGDWDIRGTLDRVSDSNYLQDFNFGYIGLNRYSRELLLQFGRDLEQEDVNTRVSTLLMARNFSVANFTAYGRYYERTVSQDPNLFNRLPGMSFTSVPVRLGLTPLYLGLDSSYNYFYQFQGMAGDRLDLHPQAWLQSQVVPGVGFSSRVGLRETVFRIDHNVPTGPPEGYVPRQLFDTRVALTGNWGKDYFRGEDSPTFFRHVVRPELTYWNLPRYDPARYPQFDPFDQGWVATVNRHLPVREGDDPIGGVNAMTYGIGNHIMRRSATPQGLAVVNDLLWFRVTQSAFFNHTNMGLNGTNEPHHPFSDFWGEMEVTPIRQVVLGANIAVSPYYEGVERTDFKIRFLDINRQNYLNVNYILVKNFAKQINVEAYLNLMRSLKTWVTYGHTFQTNNKLEKRYGLVLQRQCWGVVISYTDRPDDQRIGFTVFIPGLGEKMKRSPIQFPDETKGNVGPDIF